MDGTDNPLALNQLYNMDCMEGMKLYPDGYFDLAIVDPPYGGGGNDEWLHQKRGRFGGRFDKYQIERTGGALTEKRGKTIQHWDVAPDETYFKELFRVSKQAIVWGGNYFDLPPCRCFLVWEKLTISESFTMAMCEYAWTNIHGNAKIFKAVPQGKDRFHPTQKPVQLYKWILNHFAKPGYKILDTHAGSASSLIACHAMGFDYVGFEIDTGYYTKAQKRLEQERAQVSMHELANQPQEIQTGGGDLFAVCGLRIPGER